MLGNTYRVGLHKTIICLIRGVDVKSFALQNLRVRWLINKHALGQIEETSLKILSVYTWIELYIIKVTISIGLIFRLLIKL